MKNTGHYIIKATAFAAVFCLLFAGFSFILLPYDNSTPWKARMTSFYDQPENSIDVLYLGSSYVYSGIIPLEIWKYQGFTGFVRANAFQSPLLSYYYLSETLEYQNPKVVVVEVDYIFKKIDVDNNEGMLRYAVDPLNFSKTKLRLIEEIVSLSNTQTEASYLFPLLRYHTRWDELAWNDLFKHNNRVIDINKGYLGIRMETKPLDYPGDRFDTSNQVKEFKSNSLEYYERIIDLCQQKDIEMILITMPGLNWDYAMHQSVQQLADQYHLQYLDFNVDENLKTIGLDGQTDFLDGSHLNTIGAQKVSRALGAFLQETFDLKDKSGNPDYRQWDIDLKQYEDELAEAIRGETGSNPE